MDRTWGCGECGEAGLTEQEAVLHVCGYVPPEPTYAPEPKTTADVVAAIQGLALQVARVADALEREVEG